MVYFLPASFFYCSETHKMALPYHASFTYSQKKSWISVTLPLSILTFPRKFFNHAMGRLGEWVWKTTTGMCSLLLCILNQRSLSLWSSVISSLPDCYFLGYWTASLKRNTEWSRQERTSRGKSYNNLITFGLPNIIYLPTKSPQKFKSLSWTS